jgi:hypothetical protein
MKTKRLAVALAAIMACFAFVSGCDEDNDSSGTKGTLIISRGPTKVKESNYNRTSLVMTDGWTVMIGSQTEVLRQRPSCSGFDVVSISAIDIVEDYIEYSFDQKDLGNKEIRKTVNAVKIEAYREECLFPPREEKPCPIICTNNIINI